MPRSRVPPAPSPKSSTTELEVPFAAIDAKSEANNLKIRLDLLTEHAVIAGGSSEVRTEVAKQFLSGLHSTELPFTIIASNQAYRSIMQVESTQKLLVFSLGDTVLPLSVNPLELLPNVAVSVHIAKLAAVFRRIYDLSNATACALEKTIEAAYERRGWTIKNNSNDRLMQTEYELFYHPDIFPVMAELLDVLDTAVDSCKFDPKVKSDAKTTIQSILTPLISGVNRTIFNSRSTSSVSELFDQRILIETNAMRVPQDRALFAAILLNFCEESFQRPDENLRHLFILDDCGQMPELFGHGAITPAEKLAWDPTPNFDNFTEAGYGVIFVGLRGWQFEATGIARPGISIIFRERNTFALSSIGAFLDLDLTALTGVKGLAANEMLVILADGAESKNNLFSLDVSGASASPPAEIFYELPTESSGSGNFGPLASAGTAFFLDAFEPEYLALAEKLAQNKNFYRVFVRYITSFTNDLTQLVHFRAQVIHEIQRIVGRKMPEALRKISWCAISLASDRYFGEIAIANHWTLEQERTVIHQWYGLLAPAFVPETVNPTLNRRLNIVQVRAWRDEFLSLQSAEQGPLPACAACTSKCLFSYDVAQFLADPGLFFDFNSSISRRDTSASESSAWFVRLLCERLIGMFNLDLAYCLAVHLIKAQQLSMDAQLVLLRKVRQHLLVVSSEDAKNSTGEKTEEVRIILFPKIIKDQ